MALTPKSSAPAPTAAIPPLKDSIFFLRRFRLNHLPPARYAAECLHEAGFSVLVGEFDEFNAADVPQKNEPLAIRRYRLRRPWWLPRFLHSSKQFLSMVTKLARACQREGKPRLIIAQGLQEQFCCLILKQIFGTPYAVQVHEAYDYDDLKGFNKLLFLMEGPSLRGAEFLVFPGHLRKKTYTERYQLKESSFVVFNTPRVQLVPERRDLRKELGLSEESFLLGYIGGIGEVNAIEAGIEGIARVPGSHFILYGWGEEDYLGKLKSLTRALKVEERVHFCGPTKDEKWRLFRSFDASYCVYHSVLLRLQDQAAPSNKLWESLSVGTPVVVAPNPDSQALVRKYGFGIAVNCIDGKGIADAIATLQSKSIRNKMAEKGRHLHLSLFNFETQFQPVKDKILRLAQSSANIRSKP